MRESNKFLYNLKVTCNVKILILISIGDNYETGNKEPIYFRFKFFDLGDCKVTPILRALG